MAHKTAAIAVLIISLIVGGYLIYLGYTTTGGQARGAGGTPFNQTTTTATPKLKGEKKTYTLPLLPGEKLYYTNAYYPLHSNKPASNSTYWIQITDVDWPFIVGTYQLTGQNRTGVARMAVGNLAIPKELLGSSSVTLPIVVPAIGSGLCAGLSLEGRGNYTMGNKTIPVLIYGSSMNLTGTRLLVKLYYEASSGLLVKANFTIILGGKAGMSIVQSLINASKGGTLRVSTPDTWICKPYLASDLRFQAEGTLLIQGLRASPVPAGKVREVSLGDGIVLVILKDGQEVTQEFWRNILAASAQCPSARIYAIVVGGLTDNITISLAKNILERSVASEQTVLIRFQDGKAVDKVYRYGSYREILNLLCGRPSTGGRT
ncbi:MAG: hypothetical protein F7C33_06050 [Desulfurococcales archaeon]|nr:hypothetical protein [Desulfurococcales archaeon]